MIRTRDLWDVSHTLAAPLLEKAEYPWLALGEIKAFILAIGPVLPRDEYEEREKGVWIARDAVIAPSALVGAPCIIGHEAEIRHCAFIRGGALIGQKAVVGNSTEVKNAILFDRVQVPHFNYVGDSILGFCAHLGAGAVTSNVKSDKSLVTVRHGEERLETGLKKMGAMVGDYAEVGCNSVLNPGTILGKHVMVYPLSRVRGVIPENHILKGERGLFPRE